MRQQRKERDRHLGNVLSAAEQDGHDQRMGKPDLDAVHETVPCALEDGEVVMVSRVVEDGLQCSSGHINRARAFQKKKRGGGSVEEEIDRRAEKEQVGVRYTVLWQVSSCLERGFRSSEISDCRDRRLAINHMLSRCRPWAVGHRPRGQGSVTQSEDDKRCYIFIFFIEQYSEIVV